ncbi:efflux transporter outer membrane subunit [Parahaliea mediterranea]|uniref:Efflux transporter outer membrane subunit n=1 Tax=Parahaliea mediterranea TaxID=651086 RepID=A0A939DBT1_9GAMM|nr:efflux transporter outer membrane subunit [Parahaliea mediterranea]MBN7795011.1 efflux transporter outer membrane subunit [Parahaliea mediterranea]
MGNVMVQRQPEPRTNSSLRGASAARFLRQFIGGSLIAGIAACGNLAGPDYQRPDSPGKSTWRDGLGVEVADEYSVRPDWWRGFNDPYLDQLIQRALDNNIDLQILGARIGVAEAAIGQANAARLPTVDAALGANAQQSGGGQAVTSYSGATAIGWELDIWGKLEKGVRAQEAELRATGADWRAGYLTLISDLSSLYFTLRQYDEQLYRQRQALVRNEQIAGIYRSLHDEGVAPQTRVLQQEAEIDALRNGLLELERLRTLAENALATLLGMPAGELRVPTGNLSDDISLVAVPGGLPSDLLTRRPDIVAAEYRVLQAHELVGQARLARLPSFSLTSGLGTTSGDLSGLLQSWTLGLRPTISIPIFDPAVSARIKVSEASSRVVEQEYRRTVIRAFEEVENALVNLDARRQQRQQIVALRNKLQRVAAEVEAQLREGLVSQLEVLESQRSLLSAELALLSNQRQLLDDTVQLYKALGGGWPAEQVRAADAPGSVN